MKRVEAAQTPARRGRRRWLIAGVLLAVVAGGYYGGREALAGWRWRQAQAALAADDYPAALAGLDRCLESWPGDPRVHLLLARAHRLAGHPADAARHLQAARDAGGDVTLEAQLADASAGRLAAVEGRLLRQLRDGHPDRRYIREALVRGYLVRDRNADAERLASEWIAEAPGSWPAYLLRAAARTQMSQRLQTTPLEQAKQDYQRVLELRPDHDLARYLLGNAYLSTGQFREALPHLERFHEQKPDDPQGVADLAACRRALGRVDDARALLDGWLAGHRGTPEVFLARGEVAMDLGQPGQAVEYYRQAAAVTPRSEKVHFLLAAAYRALGQADDAARAEEEWRRLNTLAAKRLAMEVVAEKEPTNVAARFEAGAAALQLGDEAAGVRWLEGALQLDPRHRPTHAALADYHQRKGNAQAAAMHRQFAGASQ